MDLSGDDDGEMKRYLTAQFSECQALTKLIEATPPHQIHRRRIEVEWALLNPEVFSHSRVAEACRVTIDLIWAMMS